MSAARSFRWPRLLAFFVVWAALCLWSGSVGAQPAAGADEPGAPIGQHRGAEAGEPGSAHEGACPGHGPTDRPPVVNLLQGWFGVWNDHAVPPPDGARIGSFRWWLWHLTPYPFRYENPKDECDPRNQPTPLVAPVLNFAVLGFLVWRFGRKPLREALKKRAATIRAGLDQAKEQKRKARERLAEYRGELDHLDDTLVALRQRYAEEAEREQQELLRQAEQARDRLLADAAVRVEQEARAARDVLSRQAMEQALGAAEALLRTAVSSQDRDRLGEQYLASLGAALRPDGLGPRQGMTP